MKVAFTTLACPSWNLAQIIAAAQQFGYDGIELRLLDGDVMEYHRDREKIVNAVNLIRENGLEVCAFDTSCTLNQATKQGQQEQVESMRSWIQLASELQVPVIRVFGGVNQSGSETEPSEEEVHIWMAGELNAVAEEAQQAGVVVALETHDAFSSAYRVARLLDKVNKPAVGALWDGMHTYRAGEPDEEVSRVLGSRIMHYHVKDATHLADGKWEFNLLGEGEIPVDNQLLQLAQLGYDGWVSVEWEKKWHPEIAEPEVVLPQYAAWLKTYLPTLKESLSSQAETYQDHKPE
ncbi:sugar phosphate isomerase/epimerase family protein [Ktedonospora formicarum]|uniref:Xylose isomerase-like TIM barrel domain-containing protein n=1 Tax=Ktedonospora formicarum TaxID=2778364 RepID=A0A8J3MTX7_9CHLR|nr:sugar phosphate isomerase/epimerase family protein [Ktedonospora formicarum]GHO46376.1 hypothetical protein KSX_45390 [Ktedonospora formicarum]